VASGFLTWERHPVSDAVLHYSPAALVLLGALMLSKLLLPKLVHRRSRAFNVFQYGNVACAYVLGPLMLFPEYLFALAASYTVGGVLWCLAFPPKSPAAEATERELAT
jgi:hypothetical protein